MYNPSRSHKAQYDAGRAMSRHGVVVSVISALALAAAFGLATIAGI